MISLNVRRAFESYAPGETIQLPDLSAQALVRAYPGVFDYVTGSQDSPDPDPSGDDAATLPIASSRDYGFIRYGEMMGATTVAMPANVDTPFVVRSPRTVKDKLKGRFAGFAFFGDDNVLRCQQADDSYLLSIRLTVTPQIIGGWFSLGIMIDGNISGLSGPTSSRQVYLGVAAGADYRFDEVYQVFPSSGFAANGATLVMRSSVPVALSNDVLFITPLVTAP